LNPGIAQAFQHLPVDQAIKAVEMAVRFQGQRGYMRDLQSGMNAAQAFAKWGPMLFHSNATGIPEAIQRSVPPQVTPYQQQELAMRKQQMQAAAQKLQQPKLHYAAGGEIIRELPGGKFEVLRKPIQKPTESITESYQVPEVPAQEAQPAKPASSGFFGIGARPAVAAKPAVAGVPAKTIRKTSKIGVDAAPAEEPAADPAEAAPEEPANPAATETPAAPAAQAEAPKVLTKELAIGFLKAAKGDKEKARKLAKDSGYKW
jgi:hypothetical protein